MKKLLILSLLGIFTGLLSTAQDVDFALSNPGLSPVPAVYPGVITISYKFSVVGGNYAFSSDDGKGEFGNISISFLKTDPPAPTGTGAALFTWVRTVSAGGIVTYTGSTRDVSMQQGVAYDIVFANAVVTASSDAAQPNIGSGANFNEPTSGVSGSESASGRAYTYSVAAGPLPVSWLSFTAARSGGAALLSWSTAMESNTSIFTAERSVNGGAYAAVGSVKAAGSSSTPKSYTLTDASPVAGTNSYRVKQVDNGGRYSYSETRQLSFSGTGSITVYPNPAVSEVMVSGIPAGSVVDIIAMNGQKVASRPASGTTEKIMVAGYAAGTYAIHVTSHGKLAYTGRFVKK